jgi:hypothetical protein
MFRSSKKYPSRDTVPLNKGGGKRIQRQFTSKRGGGVREGEIGGERKSKCMKGANSGNVQGKGGGGQELWWKHGKETEKERDGQCTLVSGG